MLRKLLQRHNKKEKTRQTRTNSSNLSPTAIENVPKEIIFTNDNMSESDNTHTPNKEETEDKKQAAGIQAKIPKTAPSTVLPHYINEEEKNYSSGRTYYNTPQSVESITIKTRTSTSPLSIN